MPEWMDVLVVPLLVGAGGLVAWLIRSRIEHRRELEARLTDHRRQTYAEILDPYIQVFVRARMKDPKAQSQIEKVVTSYEYRRAFFDLGLFGSDPVVRAYNAMMQHTYQGADMPEGPPRQDHSREMLRLWGALLLSIRREGNPTTDLTEWEMLEGMITDIENLRER